MTLRAADAGSPQMSNQVPLQVRVTDENDNSPIFDKQVSKRNVNRKSFKRI